MTELQEMAIQLQENCKTYTDCSGCPFYMDGCTIYGVPSEWDCYGCDYKQTERSE